VPAEAEREPASALTPEKLAGIQAALLRLLRLALYVALMTLLGYRIRRPRSRRAPLPATLRTLRPQHSAAPPTPPRHHRYLDRDLCLATLAGIDTQVAALFPASAAPPQPVEATTPAARPPIAASQRPHRAPHASLANPSAAVPARVSLRPHPPPFLKPRPPKAPTHVHFVTISERTCLPRS
jgi:hypothetical protein